MVDPSSRPSREAWEWGGKAGKSSLYDDSEVFRWILVLPVFTLSFRLFLCYLICLTHYFTVFSLPLFLIFYKLKNTKEAPGCVTFVKMMRIVAVTLNVSAGDKTTSAVVLIMIMMVNEGDGKSCSFGCVAATAVMSLLR